MLRLHFNENPYGVMPEIRQKAIQAVDDLDLRYYPERDADGLREALSDYTGVAADRIIISNGSNDILQLVLRAHADEIERVVIPAPTFGMYRRAAQNLGLEVVQVPLNEDFSLDVERMLSEINKGPSAVFICHPNNPTGNYFASENIDSIIDTDARLIVVDEAYFELGGRTYVQETEDDRRMAVVRTLSKGFGLAGLRAGYLLAHEQVVQNMKDIQTPYVVSGATQAIARVVVEHAEEQLQTVDMMIQRREAMTARFSKIPGMTPLDSVTNFFLVRVDEDEFGMPACKIQERMRDADILIRHFDELPQCIRVSVGLPEEADEFFRQLESLRG